MTPHRPPAPWQFRVIAEVPVVCGANLHTVTVGCATRGPSVRRWHADGGGDAHLAEEVTATAFGDRSAPACLQVAAFLSRNLSKIIGVGIVTEHLMDERVAAAALAVNITCDPDSGYGTEHLRYVMSATTWILDQVVSTFIPAATAWEAVLGLDDDDEDRCPPEWGDAFEDAGVRVPSARAVRWLHERNGLDPRSAARLVAQAVSTPLTPEH